jgi:hypothetical protein
LHPANASAAGVIIAFLTVAVPDAQADQYKIEIRQIGGFTGQRIVTYCSDQGTGRCEGQMELSVGGKSVPISVVTRLERGYADFRFLAGENILLANSDPYLHVGIGRFGGGSRVGLAEEMQEFRDDVTPTYRRAVVRIPRDILAILRIDIRPRP